MIINFVDVAVLLGAVAMLEFFQPGQSQGTYQLTRAKVSRV